MVSSVTSRWRAAQAKRRKGAFRWDLEHIEHGVLRQMALALAIYGVVVMVVCLVSFNSSNAPPAPKRYSTPDKQVGGGVGLTNEWMDAGRDEC